MTSGKPQQRAYFCKKNGFRGKYHCLELLMEAGGQMSRDRSSKGGCMIVHRDVGVPKMLPQNMTGGDRP